jgi:hypothetical protein
MLGNLQKINVFSLQEEKTPLFAGDFYAIFSENRGKKPVD